MAFGNNKISLFVLLLSSLISCTSKNKGIEFAVYVREPNDLKVRRLIYDENNKLVSDRELIKAPKNEDSHIADGFWKEYYPNQVLKNLSFWKKGVQDSVELFFDSSARLIEKDYYYKGQFMGPQIAYYDNGNISKLSYCGDDTDVLCHLVFKPNGKLDSIGGSLYHFYLNDSPHLNMNYCITYYVLYIENFNSCLEIQLLDDNNENVYNSKIYKFDTFRNVKFHDFCYTFKKPGNYKYIVWYTIYYPNSKEIMECQGDTLMFHLPPT